MSKNPKPAAASSSSSPPDNYKESPQNARLDTSESDEESVSEVNARLNNCSSSLSRAAPPKVTPEKCEKKKYVNSKMLYLKEEKNCKMRKRREEKKKKVARTQLWRKSGKKWVSYTLVGALRGWLIGGRKREPRSAIHFAVHKVDEDFGRKKKCAKWGMASACVFHMRDDREHWKLLYDIKSCKCPPKNKNSVVSRHQDDPTERVEHFLGFKTFFFSFFLVWLFNHLRRAVRRVCTLTFVRPLQCTACRLWSSMHAPQSTQSPSNSTESARFSWNFRIFHAQNGFSSLSRNLLELLLFLCPGSRLVLFVFFAQPKSLAVI